MIDRMCALMFRSLQDAWQPYVETEVTLVNREVNPLFANIAADDETVVLNRFTLGCLMILWSHTSILFIPSRA